MKSKTIPIPYLLGYFRENRFTGLVLQETRNDIFTNHVIKLITFEQ